MVDSYDISLSSSFIEFELFFPDEARTERKSNYLPFLSNQSCHFNGGMTRRIISTFRLAEPAIAMWARKRAPRVKSSAPYCRLVVGTPDVHR